MWRLGDREKQFIMTTDSRSVILKRIKVGLRKPASYPESPLPTSPFPNIPPDDLVTRLERELRALRADFFSARNHEEAAAWIKQITDQHELRRVVISPQAASLGISSSISAHVLSGENDCGKNLADAELAITGCDCLLAFTGSVVLTTHTGFGRALSVLPPAHLVVARRSQVVANLYDAYRLLYTHYGRSWPSMITVITGPSRTADIEKIIVLGAHGPKKLFILLLDF